MKQIGTFQSKRWGTVHVFRATYDSADGPLAVVLQSDEGEPIGKLSVNMYRPECTHDSKDLPKDCFYVKQWFENELIVADALHSGLFVPRDDLEKARSGPFAVVPVWQLKATEATTSDERRT